MACSRRHALALAGRILLVVVLLSGLFAGSGVAQGDQPEWADGLLGRIETAAERYNAGETADQGVLERLLLSEATVNVHVEGPDDSAAVVSFRTDERLRIIQLRSGGYDDPTLRVRTSKDVVERVAGADDIPAAIEREVWNGRIRIERLYELLPGVVLAVGTEEVIIGSGSVVLAAGAAAKFGVKGAVYGLWGWLRAAAARLVAMGRTVVESMGGVASALTVLEQLGLLDRTRAVLRRGWERLRTAVAGVLGRSPPESGDDRDG